MRSIIPGYFHNGTFNTVDNRYFSIGSVVYTGYPSTTSNESTTFTYIPTDMYIEKLYMRLSGPPGVGKSYTVTLMKNGVDTEFVLIFSGTEEDKSYTPSTPLFISKGDILKFRVVPFNSPTAQRPVWTFRIRTTSSNYYVFLSDVCLFLATSSYIYNYISGCFIYTGLPKTNIDDLNQICSVNGTLKSFHVKLRDVVATGLIRFTLFKNKVATSLTVDITTGLDFAEIYSDVTVSRGDVLSWGRIGVGHTGVSTYGSIATVFKSDIDGEFPILGGSDNSTLSNTVDSSFRLNGCGDAGDSLSSISIFNMYLFENLRIRDFFVELITAPGIGKSRSFTLYKNSSPTDLTFTISDTAKTGNNTIDEITSVTGDNIAGESTPSGTPSDSVRHYSGLGVFLDQIDEVLVDQEAAIACVNVIGSTISNLEHLEGKEVIILADGEVIEGRTVTNGQLVPPLEHSYATTHIGLRYDSDLGILQPEVD